MKPLEVAKNQRRRMYGAMIEAVAASGYGRTSVKQVVMLAGVSRRAFYEQFANKEECFLATLDLIASQAMVHIAAGYRSTEGTLEQRMGAALRRFAEVVASNPKGARLMLVDAPSAGPAGWERLTETMRIFEQRLAASFAHAPDAAPLPEPVARAIVGGLAPRHFRAPARAAHRRDACAGGGHAELDARLQDRRAKPARGAPARRAERDVHRRRGRTRARAAQRPGAGVTRRLWKPDADADRRRGRRVDRHLLRLFDDMEECFLAAIEQLGEDVRKTVSDPASPPRNGPPRCAARWSDDALLRRAARLHPDDRHRRVRDGPARGRPGRASSPARSPPG